MVDRKEYALNLSSHVAKDVKRIASTENAADEP
jgi:hypothetical protein